jgi:serine/threonine protein kinase
MAPQVTSLQDLDLLCEASDVETHDVLYTTFAVIDADDVIYFGQLDAPSGEISYEQFTSALSRIPDEEIYPELPPDEQLTMAPEGLAPDFYIKRPKLTAYEDHKEQDVLSGMREAMLEEAHALQIVSQHPHPNIIRYHGCRVQRGRVTGLVLDRYNTRLKEYLRNDVGTIDKESFMAALESAVSHLHSIGLAHNDINPANIMVNDAGMPVLIDFGSSHKIGEKMTTCRGTPGWIDEEDDYTMSLESHDTCGLGKIRVWLDQPKFDW